MNALRAALPAAAPASLAEAYAIQNAMVAAAGAIGGWKVAPLCAGATPRCSPLPAAFFAASPARFAADFLVACRAEVEIAIRLGADPGADATPEQVAAAIAAIHPAVELLCGRHPAGSTPGDLHRLADLQGCAGVITGPGLTDWHGVAFDHLAIEISRDGATQRAAPGQPSTAQTLAALAWLATHAHQRGLPLKPGDIVITGARFGPFDLNGVTTLAARLETLGGVELTIRNPTGETVQCLP